MVVANNVLPVLIARAGGSVTITEEEFDEVKALYGGSSKMTMVMEAVGDPGTIRVTLARKQAAQGELAA